MLELSYQQLISFGILGVGLVGVFVFGYLIIQISFQLDGILQELKEMNQGWKDEFFTMDLRGGRNLEGKESQKEK